MIGREFKTIDQARTAIQKAVIDAGLSFKFYKGGKRCYVLICKKNTECKSCS